jgi:hypothetical protein
VPSSGGLDETIGETPRLFALRAVFGIQTVSERYTRKAVEALKAAGFDTRTLFEDDALMWRVLVRVSGTQEEIATAEDRIMDIGDATGIWDGHQPDEWWEEAQPA